MLTYETWEDVVQPLCKCTDVEKLNTFLKEYDREDLVQLFFLVNHLQSSPMQKNVLHYLIQNMKKDPAWIKVIFKDQFNNLQMSVYKFSVRL